MSSARARLIQQRLKGIHPDDNSELAPFVEKLLTDEVGQPPAGSIVSQLVLHTASDRVLSVRGRRALRSATGELASQGVAYLDQTDLASIPGFRRWGSDSGLSSGLAEVVAGVSALARERIRGVEELNGGGTVAVLVSGEVLFGHGAQRNGKVGRRLPASMRVLRTLRLAIPAVSASLVVHHPGDDAALDAMYHQYVRQGGTGDDHELRRIWGAQQETHLQDWVELVETLGLVSDVTILPLSRASGLSSFGEGLSAFDGRIGSSVSGLPDEALDDLPPPPNRRRDRLQARFNCYERDPKQLDRIQRFLTSAM